MSALFEVLYMALSVYQLILLARVLMTWLPNLDPNNPIARFFVSGDRAGAGADTQRAAAAGVVLTLSPLVVFLGISILMQLVI